MSLNYHETEWYGWSVAPREGRPNMTEQDKEIAALRSCIRMLIAEHCRYYPGFTTQAGRTYPAEWNQKHLPLNQRSAEREATPAERDAIARALADVGDLTHEGQGPTSD